MRCGSRNGQCAFPPHSTERDLPWWLLDLGLRVEVRMLSIMVSWLGELWWAVRSTHHRPWHQKHWGDIVRLSRFCAIFAILPSTFPPAVSARVPARISHVQAAGTHRQCPAPLTVLTHLAHRPAPQQLTSQQGLTRMVQHAQGRDADGGTAHHHVGGGQDQRVQNCTVTLPAPTLSSWTSRCPRALGHAVGDLDVLAPLVVSSRFVVGVAAVAGGVVGGGCRGEALAFGFLPLDLEEVSRRLLHTFLAVDVEGVSLHGQVHVEQLQTVAGEAFEMFCVTPMSLCLGRSVSVCIPVG